MYAQPVKSVKKYTKAAKKQKKPKNTFAETLNRIVDEIYACADEHYGWDWKELARKADLTYQTVYRLGERITVDPKYRTVWKLCKAVGFNMGLVEKVLKKSA